MREAVITAAVRTPVGRAPRGRLKDTRPDDLAALVIDVAVKGRQAVVLSLKGRKA